MSILEFCELIVPPWVLKTTTELSAKQSLTRKLQRTAATTMARVTRMLTQMRAQATRATSAVVATNGSLTTGAQRAAQGAVSTSQLHPRPRANSSLPLAIAAAAGAFTAAVVATNNARNEESGDKALEYAQVVELLREQVSEFRATLKSTESRIPKSYPIQKIAISRTHAPNGVSTIRVEFVCPPFVDQEAVLGRFLLGLQKMKGRNTSPIEVVAVQGGEADNKSIVESYDQPSVNFLYSSGHGSFQFLRDTSMQGNKGTKFVFYKDESLTPSEVEAVVDAYKELYSYPNVHAFFKYERDQTRRKVLVDRGPSSPKVNGQPGSKEEAIQQLQGLGIDVYEPIDNEDSLNWDSLAGYEEVKLEIEDTVVLALQNPELYDQIARKTRARYESNRPRAVLFEGPPGTGKTLSARIIAQQAGIPMIHIPIESVVSKWYGDSEKKMSAIFDACEKFDGAIIFIDEIDALAGDRSGGTMHEASRRILSVLLQKVEGFASAKKTTVVCATNRKQDLDSALISRFDLSIRYELPNERTRRAVFARYAQQLNEEDLAQLAGISSGLSCRDIKEICEYAERKWASKLLKKEVTDDLPPLVAYMDATKVHAMGVTSQGPRAEVFEA